MKLSLKHISEQVVVVTGASSGIGLATARMAAHHGARVVLAARDQKPLDQLREELTKAGAQALAIATDVRRLEDVESLAERSLAQFGAINTWVNNAGGSIYGKIVDIPVEEERQLFETNYWGIVYGSRIAAKFLQDSGGAIINLGSVASDRAIPLQAAYCASKHAIKAYTNALRAELERDGVPIAVTLIKPTGIDTPFFRHAKTYMGAQPIEPSSMYCPEVAAKAILYAAQHPIRDILVGGMAPVQSALGTIMPRLGDLVINRTMFKKQKSKRRPKPHENRFLERASGDLHERGDYPNVRVFKHSLYTEAAMRPAVKGLLATGALIGLATSVFRGRNNHHDKRPKLITK